MMGGYGPGMMGPGMMGGYGPGGGCGPSGMMEGFGSYWAYSQKRFTSNGEQIYYTGASQKNGPILRVGGPPWVQHIRVGCVACHGVQGRGGVPVMMGTAIPEDVRYSTLTASEHHEEGEKKEEMDHPPYSDATIKEAIAEGVDPANKPMDWTMPRWKMADQDLNDVIAYLRTLR